MSDDRHIIVVILAYTIVGMAIFVAGAFTERMAFQAEAVGRGHAQYVNDKYFEWKPIPRCDDTHK